ncbi:9376_t:CDS:2, partial [Ambispora gerdemannii]
MELWFYLSRRDVRFLFTDYPGIKGAKVHAGFLNTSKNITNLVKEIVPKTPGYKVVLTGHSLDGTVAGFQSLELVSIPGLSRDNLFVYAYGQLRIERYCSSLTAESGWICSSFTRVLGSTDSLRKEMDTKKYCYEQNQNRYQLPMGSY